MTADINGLEKIVDGFRREADAVLNVNRGIPLHERRDITRRIFDAKENAARLTAEIENKE